MKVPTDFRARGAWPRLLVLAVVASSSGACRGDARADRSLRDAAPVTVATVTRRDIPLEVRAFGLVEASHTVNVVSQVTGLVREVHFAEGDAVRAGDLLFTVDTRAVRASLAAIQAQVARDQVVANQARVEAERFRRLRQEGVASEIELTQAEAAAASAAAAVSMGRAQVQGANLNVSFTRVTAPIDGRTGALLVHAGNVVQASDSRVLVVIRCVKPVQIKFSVPQEYFTKIRERLARATLNVRATPRGSRGEPAVGTLKFMENAVDSSTGTLALKATFPNADERLWPGAAVDVALELDVDRAAVVAPDAAIQAGQDGTYAYVVRDGKAVRRPVKVARSSAEVALVSEGLTPGERVVIDGQIRLRDGVRVNVEPARATSDPSSAASSGAPIR